MSTRWRGGNWTAGNWDANNWLGPNEPLPPGSISGSVTITISAIGTLTGGADGFISGSASFGITASGTLTPIGDAPPVVGFGGGGSGGFVGGIFRIGDEKPGEFDAAWDKRWRERIAFDELAEARERKQRKLRQDDEDVAAMICAMAQAGVFDEAA